MDFGLTSVVGITVICYLIGMICKSMPIVPDKAIPAVCGVSGMLLGIAALQLMPDYPARDIINAMAIGIVSGLAATGVNQLGRQMTDRV